jgi:hypothetical protein
VQCGLKHVAAGGLTFVRQHWKRMRREWALNDARDSPHNPAWDIHVNVPSTGDYIPVRLHCALCLHSGD